MIVFPPYRAGLLVCFAALPALLFTSCAPTISVARQDFVYASPLGSEASSVAGGAGRQLSRRATGKSRHEINLDAARQASRELLDSGVPAIQWPTNPRTAKLLEVQRHALSLFIDEGGIEDSLTPEFAEATRLQVEWSMEEEGHLDPRTFTAFEPAALRSIRGLAPRFHTPGYGAAVVGVRDRDALGPVIGSHFTTAGSATNATLVAEFPGPGPAKVRFSLVENRVKDHWQLGSSRVALDYNPALSVALSMNRMNDIRLGLLGLISVAPRLDLAGIYMVEPYDPDRIPVLMIHGLQSSPLIWREMMAEYLSDPVLKKRYQFWAFYYPTGLSILDSARILRSSVANLRAELDPAGNAVAFRRMVVVGHSMGGILSRSLVVDLGNNLWNQLSEVPFQDVDLSASRRDTLRASLFWEPERAVESAVFIATPHRGSDLALGILGSIGRNLIHLPREILEIQLDMLQALSTIVRDDVHIPRVQSSIVGLAPNSNLSRAMEASPFLEGVSLHSIIGDRGRGGPVEESSDGVVPYWSSHLDAVESELIVPTGHSAFASPLAVEEVRRILLENLE